MSDDRIKTRDGIVVALILVAVLIIVLVLPGLLVALMLRWLTDLPWIAAIVLGFMIAAVIEGFIDIFVLPESKRPSRRFRAKVRKIDTLETFDSDDAGSPFG